LKILSVKTTPDKIKHIRENLLKAVAIRKRPEHRMNSTSLNERGRVFENLGGWES
jgi:hypothetical protein